MNSRYIWGFIILTVIPPVLFFVDVLFGSVSIPASETFNILLGADVQNTAHEVIIVQSRLPKAFAAVICGAALSLSGLQMQTLFRNPLAGPYILGISSGAGLGVAILVMAGSLIGVTSVSSLGISLAAMVGAATVLIIVFLFSLRIKDIMTVLIVGIMLGSIFTAVIGIIQFASSEEALKNYLLWSLGSLDGLTYQHLTILSVCFAIGVGIVISQIKNLNLLLLGENYAQSLGLSINRSRVMIILSTSLLAGSVTAFCGPIGFVGIIVPHICRMLFQTSNHLILVPSSLLMGISILLLSDILSHLPGTDLVLPINSITSIIGIPVILWIIIKRKSIATGF